MLDRLFIGWGRKLGWVPPSILNLRVNLRSNKVLKTAFLNFDSVLTPFDRSIHKIYFDHHVDE